MIFNSLQAFRQALYDSLGNAKAALFDLMDAVLVSSCITSFVSLSQSPVFRRRWGSTYAAVQDGRVPRAKVLKLVVGQIPCERQPVFAGDTSRWERPAAKTLKDRSFSKGSGGGISVGHSYSTLAWLPEEGGSWAVPVCHERVTSFETPVSRAAFQLKQVSRLLPVRPLGMYDRAYGNASFVNQTADIDADLLVRVASNRCVYGAPPAYQGRGAPRKHGHKMKLNAPETWLPPDESVEVTLEEGARVRVSCWRGYHFKQSSTRPMDLVRVEVLEAKGKTRHWKPLWLAWLGKTRLPLERLWSRYLCRFSLEHWYRFAKQRLYWTHPQFSSIPANDRWSALMPLLSWQLWLARADCADHPLPWQSPQDNLSPGRVAQAFASILVAIGTPAPAPQPRGKSPGRTPGECPAPRPRYPTVKKRTTRRKTSESSLNPPEPVVA